MGNRKATLLVLPAAVISAFVVLGGLLAALVQSLGLLPFAGPPQLGADAYLAVAPDLPSAVALSFGIAAASTLIAVVFGFVAAMLVVRGRFGGRLISLVSTWSIPFPHLVGAASMGLLLGDAGLLARIFGADSWPELVGGPAWIAVIAAYSWKESAFVALVLTGVLLTRATAYDETAALLGAGRWRRLRHVLFPLSLPALGVSATIVFVYVFGSYEVAWLLGRPYPEPLPVMALRLFGSASLSSRPEAAALAVVTTIVALSAAGLAALALRRVPLWR